MLLPPSRTDSLNGVNWNDAGSDLDWQGLSDSPAATAPVAQPDHPSTPPAAEAEGDAYQVAMDLYFAEEE
jgi:hypothetical protein